MTTQPLCTLQWEAAIIGSPHPHCSLPLCRGEEATDGKHFDKMQRAWEPLQYSEDTEVIVPTILILSPKIQSLLTGGMKYAVPLTLWEVQDSEGPSIGIYMYMLSGLLPLLGLGFRLQNCRNEKIHKKDRRTRTLIWILFFWSYLRFLLLLFLMSDWVLSPSVLI